MNKAKTLFIAAALLVSIGSTALAGSFPPMPPGHPDQADMTVVNNLSKPLTVAVRNSLGKLANDAILPHTSKSYEDKGYVPYGDPAQLNATIGNGQDPAGQCQAVSKSNGNSSTASTVHITKQADGSQSLSCEAVKTTLAVSPAA